MIRSLTLAAIAGAALAPAALSQDARSVIEQMRARQAERWEAVDDYTVYLRMEGFEIANAEIFRHYQKYVIDGRPAFGQVPNNEYMYARQQEEGTGLDSEGLRQGADAMDMTGEAIAAEMQKSGAPMLPGMDPRETMGGQNAMFLRAAADAQDEAAAGDFGRGDAVASLEYLDEFADLFRLVGTETEDGREAYHLRAEGLDRVISEEGAEQTFTLHNVSMWIDVEHLVQLRSRMEGTVEGEGETRELVLEQLRQDYREVGPLYEAHREVMRMEGMMQDLTPEQREELEEARRQMEEFEAQKDQIPEAARGMVERQMERMRQQMDMLTGGGGFEMVTHVIRIEINEGPPAPPKPEG